MQITASAPIIYLPENLWSFFTRPGRELLIRVVNIEGKTLDLELGGERFQARVGGTINPEDFKPGETIRVRVIKTGHPIVLQLISEEKEAVATDLKLFYLVQQGFEKGSTEKVLLRKDLDLLATFVKDLVSTDKKEKKTEVDKDLKKILGEKIKALKVLYQHDKVVVPFLFNDERSWGFLELNVPQEEKGKVRLFYLKLFFEYLGLVECYISYSWQEIFIDFYFVNPEAFKLAKAEQKNLQNMLVINKKYIKISINNQEVLPGHILEKKG